MRQKGKGFTIVEVSFFLAITGLLFLSVTIGVQNSIYQQRYNDAVQGFVNFMRNVYDEVLNVQTDGDGRQGIAIYGKLITFGEEMTREGDGDEDKQSIFVYDVIGKANVDKTETTTTLELLKDAVEGDVVFREKSDDGKVLFRSVGLIEEYTPSWGARIQGVDSNNDFKGMVLVVRDPKSGTVRTFVNVGDVINVREAIDGLNSRGESSGSVINDVLNSFSMKNVDFCLNPNGHDESNRRADIRLIEGANNASGVELINLDDSHNKCNGSQDG